MPSLTFTGLEEMGTEKHLPHPTWREANMEVFVEMAVENEFKKQTESARKRINILPKDNDTEYLMMRDDDYKTIFKNTNIVSNSDFNNIKSINQELTYAFVSRMIWNNGDSPSADWSVIRSCLNKMLVDQYFSMHDMLGNSNTYQIPYSDTFVIEVDKGFWDKYKY